MTENDRRVESQIIVRELRKKMPNATAIIAAYMPYLDEPDIRPLLTELLEQKNVICLGKIDGQRMVMHRIHSLDEVGRNPVTNIVEPTMTNPVEESNIILAIVPGRAFTREGLRMGRGNGGYDRWLSEQSVRAPNMKTVGVCFDCQLVDSLPVEGHDRPVDEVVTARFVGNRNRRQN